MTAIFEFRLFSLLLSVLIGWASCSLEKREENAVKYSGNKFLLILLDGFRWDYLNRPGLDGFNRIRQEGVHAEYMEPAFPSLSYPNYYSIVTGRYVESHGVTLNSMWDEKTRQDWKPQSNDSSQSHWWEGAEPLWATAAKAGLRTDMYLWPGCEAVIFGTTPTTCVPYQLRLWMDDFERELYDVTAKMENDTSDVGLVYCEQPDITGHVFGPESFLIDIVVRKLDAIFSAYLSSLDSRGLKKKINVIIVSDHGMTRVDFMAATKIPLSEYVDVNNVEKTVSHGAIVGIFAKEGKTDEVVERLKGMNGTQVWKKEDLPERFHYMGNHTPPIILLADQKYCIVDVPTIDSEDEFIPPALADYVVSGTHGYDTEGFQDMMGIFMAFGPDIRAGIEAKAIKNVDVYNLAMKLCGLQPIANNGTWDSVKDFLVSSTNT